jgi:hypothetical protein
MHKRNRLRTLHRRRRRRIPYGKWCVNRMFASLGRHAEWARASAAERCEREGHCRPLEVSPEAAAKLPVGKKFREGWPEEMLALQKRIDAEPFRAFPLMVETLTKQTVRETVRQIMRMIDPPPVSTRDRRLIITLNVDNHATPAIDRVRTRIGYMQIGVSEESVEEHLEEFYRGAKGEGVGFRLGPVV